MAGTSWATNDQVEYTKLRQKTTLVAPGAYLTAQTAFYDGQEAFCTKAGGNFKAGKIYHVMSGATSYTGNVTESVAQTYTTDSSGTVGFGASGLRLYEFLTLPNTYKFYVITKLETTIFNGSSAATSSILMGVDVVDSISSPAAATSLAAVGTAQSFAINASLAAYSSTCSSSILRAGTNLGIWVHMNTASGFVTMAGTTDVSASYQKTMAFGYPKFADNTAWTSSTGRVYVKMTYYGYS